MPDYQQGKIYKLEHSNMFYIGSTCLKWLSQRLAHHRAEIKKGTTSKVYTYLKNKDWKDVKITLLEAYPCNSKDELTARETFYIEPELNNPLCLNSRCAIPTEQSILKTKEKSYKRKTDILTCECGAEVTRGYMNQHIKMKAHCEALGIEYNKTSIRSEESLAKGKERAKEREHSTITCECGTTIKYGSRYLHRKSKAHQEAIADLERL